MIDAKRLAYFVRVAEEGSLSRASTSLHIAQPALSRQIHILEDYLGFPLFVRTSRGMQLTREGEWLRDAVVGPLRDIDLAVQNLRAFLSRVDWDIGIGLHPGLGKTLASPLVAKLRGDFHDIKFRILEGPANSQIDWLKRGTIDFALVDQPVTDDQLFDRLLASEPLMLVSPPGTDHGAGIGLRCAIRLPLVLPNQHQGARRAVDDAAKKVRRSLNLQFEADAPGLIAELVGQEGLHSLLPLSQARSMVAAHGLTLTSLGDPVVEMGIHLATRGYGRIEGSRITRIDRTLQELVIDVLR